VWFVHKLIYETKGISLEAVDGIYYGSAAAKLRNRLSSMTAGSSLRKRDAVHVNEIIPLHVAAAGGSGNARLSTLMSNSTTNRDSNDASTIERGQGLRRISTIGL